MLVDANLLLYARNRDDPNHRAARGWLEDLLSGPTRVGLPWQSLGAFLRIATNPRVFTQALSPGEAWHQVTTWLSAPAAWVPTPTDRHAELLGGLIVEHRLSGPLVTDGQLAALALEHGVGIYSTDADFARFPGLRWVDPLR